MNKRGIVLLLGIVGCMSAYGQLLPLLKEGRSWVAEVHDYPGDIIRYRKIMVEPTADYWDGSLIWDCVAYHCYPSETGWTVGDVEFTTRAIEKDGVMSLCPLTADTFSPFLSLQLEAGEKLDRFAATVRWKGEMTVGGVDRLCQYYGEIDGEKAWLVEGIGCSADIWDTGGYIPMWSDYEHENSFMLECRDEDKLVFTREDFERLEVPGTGANIELTELDTETVLYDLVGNKVMNPVDGGIYVTQGNKIVFKK